jgi:hypothetical protein
MNLSLNGADWDTYVPPEDDERMRELQEMGPHLKDFEGNIIKDKDGNPKKNYWHGKILHVEPLLTKL